jgi:hypothetical protein
MDWHKHGKEVESLAIDPNAAVVRISPPKKYSFSEFLDCIEYEESKGIETAVGDNGKAVGAYQLHQIYVDDYYRITGDFPSGISDYDFRLSKTWSRRVTTAVIQHYAQAAYPELDVTDIRFMEAAARVHNGGGDGWRNDPGWFVRNRDYTIEDAKHKIANTKAYWAKVKSRMERK